MSGVDEKKTSFWRKKLEELEKGKITDCYFLVGFLEQKVHACKFDLLTCSEYFAGLFRSEQPPFRIKHVDVRIFQLIMEFAHTGQLQTKLSNLNNCLKLAAAADEFLIESLGELCTELIEPLLKVENIWKTFDENCLVRYSAAACKKFLSINTAECLKRQINIAEEAFSQFLAIEKMNVGEKELLEASLAFVKGKKQERELFRRAALPHLRLLTLTEADLLKVAQYLSQEEKKQLALHKSSLFSKVELENMQQVLCPIKVPRNNGMTKDLYPRKSIRTLSLIKDIDAWMLGKGKPFRKIDERQRMTLDVSCVKRSILVTGFDLLCKLDTDALYFGSQWMESGKYPTGSTYENNMEILVSVVSADGQLKKKVDVKNTLKANSSVHFDQTVLVPEGSSFKLQVTMDGPAYMRKILAKDCIDNFFNWNDAETKLIFPKISIHNEKQTYTYGGLCYTKIDLEAISIFKSLSYKIL